MLPSHPSFNGESILCSVTTSLLCEVQQVPWLDFVSEASADEGSALQEVEKPLVPLK